MLSRNCDVVVIVAVLCRVAAGGVEVGSGSIFYISETMWAWARDAMVWPCVRSGRSVFVYAGWRSASIVE